MNRLLLPALACLMGAGVRAQVARPFETDAWPVPMSPLDERVDAALKARGIPAANPCSDEVFLRRAYIDVIGTLPDPEIVRSFLADRSPGKRAALIDALLQREEFSDYWSLKWGDLLRIKAEFPINLWPNAVQAYHRWVRDAIHENMPYDQFARALLTSSGSNFRDPPANFYRAIQGREPSAIAETVALTFMGSRIATWPQDRRAGMEALFSRVAYKKTEEWKEEIVYVDPSATGPLDAVLPDGTKVRIEAGGDPREAFADWLIRPENPWFARSITNRVWSWLFGRGVIHEPDDIRADNPPSNPELLAYLEQEFVAGHYDLRRLFRFILNSRTYQQSSIRRSNDSAAESLFAYYPVRRLDAEVLIDALCSISGTRESYSSPIPEPFTYIPDDQRSIALADGSITSQFLEMFGRPARDTGLESERNNEPTDAQRLHLLNSTHIEKKIEQSWRLIGIGRLGRMNPRLAISSVYAVVLSRYPTPEELNVALAYCTAPGSNPQQAASDLAWALINTKEFLYRH
jgi:hypothetical protein